MHSGSPKYRATMRTRGLVKWRACKPGPGRWGDISEEKSKANDSYIPAYFLK